ncbi:MULTISPECIES: hypothetical protein [Rhizobium]|uniref:Uncharacterized protein n=1 Tax=Rhizobium favelukesii TaxID=348824 RepID=W6RQ23_9HYPH|nr:MULTISPECIES: hypothetical protein [Rhizobium]MCA0800597.1 hypothetical protein [Rhizobium sp. T1473]MCS0457298.1 hypothetical protein [Rhizobium favelukesii]UFS81907.1 hypothetical protein LPB79_27050 [Rhizobium sp. T136]CDM56426.1 hypothetical protein LPU83_0748 [Rhizobium favelukesii]
MKPADLIGRALKRRASRGAQETALQCLRYRDIRERRLEEELFFKRLIGEIVESQTFYDCSF